MSQRRRAWSIPSYNGGVHQKNFILETVGCGVAFLDSDNDGKKKGPVHGLSLIHI